MKKLVTVIVPVYNVELYLRECVNSVLCQTYKELEIVLVDDGSTDESGAICDEFKAVDDRVVVVHKKNAGLGYARNTGLDIATGDYVIFLDGDDYIEPLMIETLVMAKVNHKADTVLGGLSTFTTYGEITSQAEMNYEIFKGEEIQSIFIPRLIGSSPTKSDSIRMSVCNTLFDLNIIRENRIRFESERQFISEDLLFDIQYYQNINKVVTLKECYYNYRVTQGSLTTQYRKDRFELSKIFYEKIISIIKELDCEKDTKYRACRYFFILLRMSIRQEHIKVSHEKWSRAIKNIYMICSDELVQNIIKEYPICKLGMKQKLFLYLVKYKRAITLYMLIGFMNRK